MNHRCRICRERVPVKKRPRDFCAGSGEKVTI